MPPEEQQTKNKAIETYADDMAGVIEESGGGVVKKIIEAEEAKERELLEENPESKRNKIFMGVSAFILTLALGIILLLTVFREKVYTVPVEPPFTPLIFTDKTSFQEVDDLKREKLIETLANNTKNTKVKNGGVEAVYLSLESNVIGLRKFVELAGWNLVLPEENLISDNFMLGVINEETKEPFLLLRMRAFSDIFPSLQA